ncbi:MAG: rhodanese-like domain-containing protein [Alphaproteobacteria bacterium]|nr:rhodanese-like domain-containing protein [Alphaproteobacteria bacterium]MBM3651366.1 rhodanese-like domain-containing protein [Alphaproteobacteria bacterium]
MTLGSLLSKLAGGGAPTIEHEDFCRVVADKSCSIIDVREPHEYGAGHVPGAKNMPLSNFDPTKLPKGDVILICQAGGRSAKALALAHGAGRTDVRHYAPGAGGWRARGGAVE